MLTLSFMYRTFSPENQLLFPRQGTLKQTRQGENGMWIVPAHHKSYTGNKKAGINRKPKFISASLRRHYPHQVPKGQESLPSQPVKAPPANVIFKTALCTAIDDLSINLSPFWRAVSC